MLPIILRESSPAPVFHAELKTLVIILQCLITMVSALRHCSALYAVVACCLGLCLLAKFLLYFLSLVACIVFKKIININSIFLLTYYIYAKKYLVCCYSTFW